MELLSRLSKLLRKQERMSSVSVYRRTDRFFVVTLHGSGGGDPCIEAGPLAVLNISVEHIDLGNAILQGLARTTHNYPYPANQQEWKRITEPLLRAAGCKSWSSFAKRTSNLRVDKVGNKLHLAPSARDKKGAFFSVTEREQHIEASSADQLGSMVASELDYAATRDDA